MPEGEDYTGICDRHRVFHSKDAHAVLSAMLWAARHLDGSAGHTDVVVIAGLRVSDPLHPDSPSTRVLDHPPVSHDEVGRCENHTGVDHDKDEMDVGR